MQLIKIITFFKFICICFVEIQKIVKKLKKKKEGKKGKKNKKKNILVGKINSQN